MKGEGRIQDTRENEREKDREIEGKIQDTRENERENERETDRQR